MVKYRIFCMFFLVFLLNNVIFIQEAAAVFSGDMSPRAESGDADYAKAIRAKRAKDWPAVIENLEKVVSRRPWHDNAHTLLGYAHRRLGNFDRALAHYNRALSHNPRHRGALEYMAVTYLHMQQPDKAQIIRQRLWNICDNMALTFSDGEFGTGCEEWEMLDQIIAIYEKSGEIIECE